MKTSVKIFRILTCVFVAAYTLLVELNVLGETQYKCMKIVNDPAAGGYVLKFDRITGDAWLYIISGVVLLLLFASTVVFLFRKGWIASIVAAVTALTGAIYSVCINTQLSEVVLWREPMRRLGISDIELWLEIKPSLARLCIVLAVCYAALCTVEYIRSRKKLGEENEQNS